MKSQLTALELNYLIKELQILIDAKVDKVFQNKKEEITFQLHAPGKGKQLLRISLPGMMYLTEYKGVQPDTPPGFCMFLRKYLKQARIRSVEQIDFERVVKIVFSTKEENFHLYIELFSDGNVLLMREDEKIISPLNTQNWKDRTIRGGVQYVLPKRDNNILDMDIAVFKEIIKNTKRTSVVRSLAVDLGLGGIYAEELCLRANVDKETKEPSNEQLIVLYNKLNELLNQPVKGYKIKEQIVPFDMLLYKEKEKKYDTYNKALDENLTDHKLMVENIQAESKNTKAIKKIEKMIKSQEEQIIAFESKIDENTQKGEKIYSNYQIVSDILDQIKKAQKDLNLQEIKSKLKGHKVIKDVDPKNKTITVELK